MDDWVLREMNVVSLHAGPVRLGRNTAIITRDGVFVADQAPQEGPCECDLFLSCAKFLTTPAYAPRLRARRLRELELVADATARGWAREVERHRCTAARIEQLLTELREPVDGAGGRDAITQQPGPSKLEGTDACCPLV